MPGGDGTGPRGMGAMTGRAAGFCAGANMPGYANAVFRRGGGFGGGGFRNRFYATGLTGRQRADMGYPQFGNAYGMQNAGGPDQQQELEALKEQVRSYESSLDHAKKRIEELEAKK